MIKIGILGSYGKTTTVELLYEYFKKLGKKVHKRSTNGINNDIFLRNCCPRLDILNGILNDLVDIDIALIELNEECGIHLYNNTQESLAQLDIIGFTKLDTRLHNHFKDEQEYVDAINRVLAIGDKLILNVEDNNTLIHNNKFYYSFDNKEAEYYFNITHNTITYKDITYDSNLICKYNQENVGVAIAVLEKANLFNQEIFREVLENIIIDNRMEKHTIGDKTIYLDSGYYGIQAVDHFKEFMDIKDLCVVYCPYIQMKNSWVEDDRKRLGQYILDNELNIVYTHHTGREYIKEDSKDVIINDCGIENPTYFEDNKEALEYALNQDYKTYLVFTRENLFEYRNIIKEKN